MKKLLFSGLLATITLFSFSQSGKKADKIINAKSVERIEKILASDDMKGRKVFSPELDKAADFIAAEFKAAGLQTWNNAESYKQEFKMSDVRPSGKNGDKKLANVVGVLPGKSKKDEYVIFSGHYDHIGIGKAVGGDSIYNGANDDAAGVTAVILLAKYFKKLDNNERTIIFVAFTAEEVGGFGSQYFSKQLDPNKVMAMFNIEMIGTDSKWGKNSAFITGYEKTDMGSILQNNLKGTGFTFYPDPYPDMQLFYRSDNATLAELGVPAHTISTAKMEDEPHYHQPSDEVKTLDLKNMAMIIKSIALSSRGIVAGKETPSRVKKEQN
jgi:Zn-dependent M28 family amino/carboxypeptidase